MGELAADAGCIIEIYEGNNRSQQMFTPTFRIVRPLLDIATLFGSGLLIFFCISKLHHVYNTYHQCTLIYNTLGVLTG